MSARNRWQQKQSYKRHRRFDDAFVSTNCDQAVEIALERIVLSAKNRQALRRDVGQIQQMRVILESGGDLLPIEVCGRPDGLFEIEDGRHRFIAHEEAGFHSISCVVH